MLQVSLYNFKNEKQESFECITYEIEKSYYKFYMSSTEIKYVPSYDWIIDIKHPYEIWESSQQEK